VNDKLAVSTMELGMPEYVDREQLSEILSLEVAVLPEPESLWWTEHRLDPFPARFDQRWHYVVARDGDSVLFFADDEDEFARGTLKSDSEIENYSLVGDLIDAVRAFLGSQTRRDA
jgi:hypothetical protein